MIQNMDLGFGETRNDTETAKANPIVRPDAQGEQSADMPELDMSGDNIYGDMVQEDQEDLEIYKKAERFKQLRLLSGNTISGDVEEYIARTYGREGRQRMALAKHVLATLNYCPSADVLLMLSCTNRARVVIATAGAGKTTSLQVEILIDKMLDKALGTGELKPEIVEGTTIALPRILYLNYNRHNVKPIEDKHSSVLCTQ